MTTKATLYLDSKMYKALKMRAIDSGQSVSSLMNEALQAQLAEDSDDINSIRGRKNKEGTPLSYEAALAVLKKDGII